MDVLCSESTLQDSDGPVTLELPEQWLWDIIDEFIYQYQSFSVWRSKAASKTEDELTSLGDAGQVGARAAIKQQSTEYTFHQPWSSYSVLNVLYSLIQKSRVHEYIDAVQEGKTQEEIGCVSHSRFPTLTL